MSATKTKKPTTRKGARRPRRRRRPPSNRSRRTSRPSTAPKGRRPSAQAKAPKEPKAKKTSALDAAAQVLAAAGEPMNTRQMIEAMAAKKLWTSPGGKTPHATLYSAILREINEKGKDARFTKTERGKFAANGKA